MAPGKVPLAHTGVDAGSQLTLGLAVMLLGAGLLLLGRRRREQPRP